MKACVEILSVVVRCGSDCDSYHKPYKVAVAASCDGGICVVKALTKPRGGFTLAHTRAILKALRALGLKAKWERVK